MRRRNNRWMAFNIRFSVCSSDVMGFPDTESDSLGWRWEVVVFILFCAWLCDICFCYLF